MYDYQKPFKKKTELYPALRLYGKRSRKKPLNPSQKTEKINISTGQKRKAEQKK